ncbi:hypothetical protein LJC13_02100 [Peptostreptococcaceae bacterium OttesenSCG-928-C18]|nr:hypothetical protein [Peptostreptococcaceae bacterium OttesenSCG-928-C18]
MNKNIDKVNKGKRTAYKKIWIAGIFAAAGLSVMSDDINAGGTSGDIVIDIVMFLGLIAIVINGIKQLKLIKKCEKYTSILLTYRIQGKIDLNKFEAITKEPQDYIIKNIEKMKDKEYIYNTYVDMNTGEILFSNSGIEDSYGFEDEILKVVCQSCGGVNKVSKKKGKECDYCGSVLEYSK